MRPIKYLPLVATAALLLPAAASADFVHVVSPGESLSSVAAADGLSLEQLAAANGLSSASQLISGSSIVIPPQSAATSAPATELDTATTEPVTTAAPATSGGYLVQPGDTLSAIAARYGVSVDGLAAANGLDPAGVLPAGSQLSISGAPVAAITQTSPAATEVSDTTDTTESTGNMESSAGGAAPTAQSVSPGEVGDIASSEGVPPSLAEAIGYQESGFNNNEVSPTGATGVMQIEPGTWDYIGSNLAGPPPLSPDSATDNIRAGSLLLHSLLQETGGDPEMAAAAYYQGLDSVRAHGMYSDTEQYVNDVMSLQRQFGGG